MKNTTKLCFSCGNDKFSITFIFSTIFKPKMVDFGKISLNLSKKMVIFWRKKGKFDKILLCFSCENDKFIITFIFSTIFKPKEIDFGKISLNLSKKMVIFLGKKVNLTKKNLVFHVEMTNSLLLWLK